LQKGTHKSAAARAIATATAVVFGIFENMRIMVVNPFQKEEYIVRKNTLSVNGAETTRKNAYTSV
jgi:hypothetical protein